MVFSWGVMLNSFRGKFACDAQAVNPARSSFLWRRCIPLEVPEEEVHHHVDRQNVWIDFCRLLLLRQSAGKRTNQAEVALVVVFVVAWLSPHCRVAGLIHTT